MVETSQHACATVRCRVVRRILRTQDEGQGRYQPWCRSVVACDVQVSNSISNDLYLVAISIVIFVVLAVVFLSRCSPAEGASTLTRP